MRKKKITETTPTAEGITPVQRIRADWRAVVARVSYKGMVGNIGFIIFLALLGIIYIANSHRSVDMQRHLNRQTVMMKNLHMENIDLRTRLMNAGTEAEIIRRGSGIGLKPLTLPAYSLSIDTSTTTPLR